MGRGWGGCGSSPLWARRLRQGEERSQTHLGPETNSGCCGVRRLLRTANEEGVEGMVRPFPG